MTSWLRQGTVDVTNGSATVTGNSTTWTNQVKAGDAFSADDGATWYEVNSVDSNTQITLATNFDGSTASAASYAIIRLSPAWSLASELATRIGDLLDSIDNEFQLASYQVANLPSASPAGRIVYVSDETGGATLAFSDGSDWRRVQDRNVVS